MALNRAGRIGPFDGILVPIAGASAFLAVTDTSQQFGQIASADLAATDVAVFTCDTDCYIAQGANPTASGADGSQLIPAGQPVLIDGAQGAKLAVIRKAVTGVATLQKLKALV